MRPRRAFEPYITKGVDELRRKTLKDIQVETAMTWTGRAVAAALLGSPDASEYAHEAIEHAALAGRLDLLEDIRQMLAHHGVEI